MRRSLLFVAATAVMASAVGTFSSVSLADCAAPTVKTVRSARPGDTITVHGQYWGTDCNDTSSGGLGCSSGRPLGVAQTDLRLTLEKAKPPDTSGGLVLADGIDADPENYRVQTEVTLPPDLPPGRYRLAMGSDAGSDYRSNVIEVE